MLFKLALSCNFVATAAALACLSLNYAAECEILHQLRRTMSADRNFA